MARVRILLPQARPQPSHLRLCEALESQGHAVSIAWKDSTREPLALALVVSLERLLYGRRAEPDIAGDAFARYANAQPVSAAFTLDLTGSPVPEEGAYAPLFDGTFAEAARDGALLARRAPALAFARATAGGPVIFARALPALERPNSLVEGRRAVADAIASMALALARGAHMAEPAQSGAIEAKTANPGVFAAEGFAQAVAARIKRLASHEPNWRIGWRSLDGGPTTMEARRWPEGRRWLWLEDNAASYYADPFIFARDGVVAIFCEEYLYRSSKGVISVFTIEASGRRSDPKIIVERPHHLSYPFLFEHDGALWMMPESSSAGVLELFRCDEFPLRWSPQGAVLSGRSLSDATLAQHDGQWIMSAATNAGRASTWDTLSIFRADSPFGPWREDGGGACLIDASAARPAGNWAKVGDVWLRPAQDCRTGYGQGTAICRLDDLREGAFAQTVVGRLAPPPGSASRGVHTLNAAAGFEAIDSLGPWTSRQ